MSDFDSEWQPDENLQEDQLPFGSQEPEDIYTPPATADPEPPIAPMQTSSIVACVLFMLIAVMASLGVHRMHMPSVIIWFFFGIAGILCALRLVRGTLDDATTYFRWEMRQRQEVPEWVQDLLVPNDERVFILTREHPIVVFLWVASEIVAILASGYFGGKAMASDYTQALPVIAVLDLALTLFVAYKVAKWWRKLFFVSNLNVKLFEDLFGDEHPNMPVSAVISVKRKTPAILKLLAWLRITKLKLGTFELDTPAQIDAVSRVRWLAGVDVLEQILLALANGKHPFDESDGTWS